MRTIVRWLNTPLPIVVKGSRRKTAFVVGCFFFAILFLFVYRPFQLSPGQYAVNYLVIASGCSVGLAMCFFAWPLVHPIYFHEKKWKIWKELSFIVTSAVIISLFNFLFSNSWLEIEFSFFQLLVISFGLGVHPIIFLLVLKFLKSKNIGAKDFAFGFNQEEIVIKSDTKKEKELRIKIDDFLLAASDNNYSTIFYREEENIENILLRVSIKNLEKQLHKRSELVRCHRSYIVNREKVMSLRKDNRKWFAVIQGHSNRIPVSSKNRDLLFQDSF